MKKASVLFVCMGNICRSPAAEGVLHALAEKAGLDLHIDSAGTEGYHVGERSDSRMRSAARKRGVEMTTLARQVVAADLSPGAFDLVIAMDHANLRRLKAIAGGPLSEHVQLFSSFLDDTWPTEVPDPYYGGEDGFEQVLDMLEAGCPVILETLGRCGDHGS
ncbi:low molecular weight protein-tyrosine-phosphatase [Neorhodopirellula pilleata]|uniref:Low molecular weight protein-tyrosine-phosphatase YfkJ n=1 Tax=Neorhodopirellula pilleata TaxID=2714738 RepID=A0A5C6A196_9BACT|nr:low molecular weight protein-tyrosine-phosphatase [Neorhodopirellula pilleata]TWT93155.1 Low molecular weight protein-tyrosine-phosphatase YfkJ [Neorhodopirellula pilleata]